MQKLRGCRWDCLLLVAMVQGLLALPGQAALVARYTFDEASSGTAAALDSGAAPPADTGFYGGATRVGNTPNSFSRGALDLTQGGSAGPGADVDKLDGLHEITVTAWINVQAATRSYDTIASDRPVSTNINGNGGWDWIIYGEGDGSDMQTDFTIWDRTNGNYGGSGIFTSPVNAAQRWAFFAVTYGGNLITSYTGSPTQSVARGSTSRIDDLVPGPNDSPFVLGAEPSGLSPWPTTRSAPIYLDDFRVYDTALSPDQIEQVRLSNVPEPALGGLIAFLLPLCSRRRAL